MHAKNQMKKGAGRSLAERLHTPPVRVERRWSSRRVERIRYPHF